MDNYIIYRIRDKTTGETYIGSTRKTLEWRMQRHKLNKKCKSWNILKNNNYTVKPILKMYCSKTTALWLERFSMNNHYKVVNSNRSIISREERLSECREYYKEYYKNNKEKERARKQVIYHCPCGGRYRCNHKSRHMKSKKHQRWKNNE
jgi:Uri superfamily endonuclease